MTPAAWCFFALAAAGWVVAIALASALSRARFDKTFALLQAACAQQELDEQRESVSRWIRASRAKINAAANRPN